MANVIIDLTNIFQSAMIHNKEVNIRLNKYQKIIEDISLHSTPLRQIAQLLAFHNLSSTEIFILDASKPSKTQLENIPYLAKHSFQQKKKICKVLLRLFRSIRTSGSIRTSRWRLLRKSWRVHCEIWWNSEV
jgi:hypothetical protein